jgi:subtilisin family serine protease
VAGRSRGGNVPRYGVAPDAELVVGKVLNNQGSGREGDILQAMLWAIAEGCAVVSMSLGRAVQPARTSRWPTSAWGGWRSRAAR